MFAWVSAGKVTGSHANPTWIFLQSQSTALPTSPHILTEDLLSLEARRPIAVAAAIAVLLAGVGAL